MQHSWRKVDVWKRKDMGAFELRETFLIFASGPMAAIDLVAQHFGYTAADYTGKNPQVILRDEGEVAQTLGDLIQGHQQLPRAYG